MTVQCLLLLWNLVQASGQTNGFFFGWLLIQSQRRLGMIMMIYRRISRNCKWLRKFSRAPESWVAADPNAQSEGDGVHLLVDHDDYPDELLQSGREVPKTADYGWSLKWEFLDLQVVTVVRMTDDCEDLLHLRPMLRVTVLQRAKVRRRVSSSHQDFRWPLKVLKGGPYLEESVRLWTFPSRRASFWGCFSATWLVHSGTRPRRLGGNRQKDIVFG